MSVVLVTGCSSGIGLATVVHFARVIHEAVTTAEPKLRYLVGSTPASWWPVAGVRPTRST